MCYYIGCYYMSLFSYLLCMDKNMRTKTWRHLKHIKIPINNSEIEISNTIERIVAAILYKNFEYLNFVILDESIFLDIDGKIRNKQQFIEERVNSGYVRDIKYLNISINIINDNTATVCYVRYILYLNYRETFTNRCYELFKVDNYWKIKKSFPDSYNLV